MIRRLASYVSPFLVIIGLSTLLFAAVNIAAISVLRWQDRQRESDIMDYTLSPLDPEGEAVLTSALGRDMTARLKASYDYALMPPLVPHPTLPYVAARMKNAHYTVGREGIRYIDGWSDADVMALLGSSRRKVFLMGGSTMFGHGVSDGDTIAAYLQRLLGNEYAVFNFGTNAYDQPREILRLMYHLRHGLRPDVVVFLDGLNDAPSLARSNYRVGDKFVNLDFLAGRSAPGPGGRLARIVRSLPATRALLWLDHHRIEAIPQDVDPFESAMDYEDAEFVFKTWAGFAERHRDALVNEARIRYRRNLQYLGRVADGFDFRVLAFYQPIGVIDPLNAMRGEVPAHVPGLQYMTEVRDAVRATIRRHEVAMIDISDALTALARQNRAYIDAQHYSPPANEEIARIFSEHITGLYNGALSPKAN